MNARPGANAELTASSPLPVQNPIIHPKIEKGKAPQTQTETQTQINTEIKLRDFLLDGLSSSPIPGKRRFHLHVLVSAERRCGSLFPYASSDGRRKQKVRVGVRDIVVILSEEKGNQDDDTRPGRVITCGIEAALYRIPQTSSGILYVSKVDSTGHGMKPSVTGVLVRRFLSFFVDVEARGRWMGGDTVKNLWVHVFARAQGEYLFFGSKEWKGKRVLGDVGLCGWWKRCLGDVGDEDEGRGVRIRRWYLMPGLNEREAEEALGKRDGKGKWEYGHPYGQKDVELPCPPGDDGEGEGYLGRVIPYFEDDPKSRFLDELANDEGGLLRSPERKKPRLEKSSKRVGEIGRVGADEFWERMGFRQECVAGAVTGFYTMVVWGGCEGEGSEGAIGKAKRGEVSDKIVERVLDLLKCGVVEFSTEEKAERATEVVENAIRGLCEGIYYRTEIEDREKTPERKTQPQLSDLTPNPFPEPVASLDTYYEHIYGVRTTEHAVAIISRSMGSSHVTRLVPRRKIK
jgi:regulator of Ty1 transposition protein 109